MAAPEPQLLEGELLSKDREQLRQLVDRTSPMDVFSVDGLLWMPSRVNIVCQSSPGCVPAGLCGLWVSVHRQQSHSLPSLGQDLLYCWELGPCGLTDLYAHLDISGKGVFPTPTCPPADEKA